MEVGKGCEAKDRGLVCRSHKDSWEEPQAAIAPERSAVRMVEDEQAVERQASADYHLRSARHPPTQYNLPCEARVPAFVLW